MTEADFTVVFMSIAWPLSVAAPLGIVHLDLQRLTPEQRARSWPDATMGVVALYFTPLLLPLHFAMSRWVGRTLLGRMGRSALGLAVGTGLFLAVLGALEGFGQLLERFLV